MRKILLRLFFFQFFFISTALTVHAQTYPWVWMSKDDLQVITSPKLEAEFRLELLRNAKDSIDLLTYDQRADELVGLPLLKEIESALQRGVRIRFATSWVAPMLKDPMMKSNRFLWRLEKKYPNFKFISFGGPRIWKAGWAVLDGIHEKLLKIDDTLLLVTGRGHADEYLGWLDTAFVMKGPLVDQSREVFEQVWSTLQRESNYGFQAADVLPDADVNELNLFQNDLEDPLNSDASIKVKVSDLAQSPTRSQNQTLTLSLPLSREELQEYLFLKGWAQIPAKKTGDYLVRTLHYDFLEQMRKSFKSPKKASYDDRSKFLIDPILNEALSLLPSTKNLNLNILATILDPRLQSALADRLQNGMKLQIITNGKEAHQTVSPLGLTPGWYAGLHSLDDLMQLGAKAYEVKKRAKDTFHYVHRKLAIFDDTVIFGSHNLTVASTLVQDELNFEVKNPDFAEKMLGVSLEGVNTNTIPFNLKEIHTERISTPYRQWFSGFFDKAYLE